MPPERYTQIPRPTLWLVQGGELTVRGDGAGSPARTVEIGSFYIGKSAVTNVELEAFVPGPGPGPRPRAGRARSPLAPGDDDPAAGVTFEEASAYCEWYARLARKPFRLPTEHEWEYACRAGTRGRYFFGDDPGAADPFVWHRDNSGGRCHPVESSRANPWGLHEMLGNAWEWMASPPGPDAGAGGERVLRGGSCLTPIAEIGSSVRRTASPSVRLDDVGFRIVRSL